MKLRQRDYIAALMVFLLIFPRYYSGSESLSVSINLAFYTEYKSHLRMHEHTHNTHNVSVNGNASGEHDHEHDPTHQYDHVHDYKVAAPVPFDLDGDGIIEAIVVPAEMQMQSTSSARSGADSEDKGEGEGWKLKVLDLRSMHSKSGNGSGNINNNQMPLYPETLFATKEKKAVPVKLKTGQMIMRERMEDQKENRNNNEESKDMDKNVHYYCGSTWNDANHQCSIHCPQGLDSECPDGESCFADTSCYTKEVMRQREESQREMESYTKTPTYDGLPTLVSVWSNGDIVLHSITTKRKDTNTETESSTNTNTKAETESSNLRGQQLELIEMWSINPFLPSPSSTSLTSPTSMASIDFIEIDVILETNAPIGKFGMVMGTATYNLFPNDVNANANSKSTMYFALDAFSGDILWRRDSDGNNTHNHRDKDNTNSQKGNGNENENDNDNDALSLSSSARRKSRHGLYASTNMSNGDNSIVKKVVTEDCLHHYGNWMMKKSSNVLPHVYREQGDDSKLTSTHIGSGRARGVRHSLNQSKKANNSFSRNRNRSRQGWMSKHLTTTTTSTSRARRQQTSRDPNGKASSNPLHFGRPNTAVFHNSNGINVISLRNGQEICHLSLLKNVLYGDVNNDGVIDHLEVLKSNIETHDLNADGNEDEDNLVPCQAHLKTGNSFEDEIISFPLCKDTMRWHYIDKRMRTFDLSTAPPLLVEGLDNDDGKAQYDMVFAMNNGLIRRYDIHGKLQWTARGGNVKDIPSWDKLPEGPHNGYLNRINMPNIRTSGHIIDESSLAAIRPIILSGDDKFAIFSSGRGQLLAVESFPQVAVAQPILTDLNGDGITDVVVLTTDGVWGYTVHITVDRSRFLLILNTVFMVAIGIALLIHNTGDMKSKDRRSTDI